jgi:hypothetical protein
MAQLNAPVGYLSQYESTILVELEGSVRSIIETYEVGSGRVREVLAVEGRIEAPNWAPSGDWLLVNGGRAAVPGAAGQARAGAGGHGRGGEVQQRPRDQPGRGDDHPVLASRGGGVADLCDAGRGGRAGEGLAGSARAGGMGCRRTGGCWPMSRRGAGPGDRRLYAGAGAGGEAADRSAKGIATGRISRPMAPASTTTATGQGMRRSG